MLRKTDPEHRVEFFRQAVERLAQSIIEAELTQVIGADRYITFVVAISRLSRGPTLSRESVKVSCRPSQFGARMARPVHLGARETKF